MFSTGNCKNQHTYMCAFSMFVSETLLQAVGMIINVVGEKVKDTVVDDLKLTLVMLLQTTQVSILTM